MTFGLEFPTSPPRFLCEPHEPHNAPYLPNPSVVRCRVSICDAWPCYRAIRGASPGFPCVVRPRDRVVLRGCLGPAPADRGQSGAKTSIPATRASTASCRLDPHHLSGDRSLDGSRQGARIL